VERNLTKIQEGEMTGDQQDKRRYPRFVVGGKSKGRLTTTYNAILINISLGGALVEHPDIVRPGTTAYMDIALQGKELRLKCRVTRSVVYRTQMLESGERELIYHTGLEFLDPPRETLDLIARYIETLPDGRHKGT
jgi:hypothetical protein